MKRFAIMLMAVVAILAGHLSCSFKEIPDEPVECPDSIGFTLIFDLSSKTVFFDPEFNYSGKPELLNYLWSFGDGENSTDKKPTHTYVASGIYLVTLKINTNFCLKEPLLFKKEIKVGAANLKANFGFSMSPESGIAPVMVHFTNLSTDTVGATYHWDFGPKGTSVLRNPTDITFDKAGIFEVKLTVKSPAGDMDDTTMQLIIRPFTFARSYDLIPLTSYFEKVRLADQAPDGTWNIAVDGGDRTVLAHISADGQTILDYQFLQRPGDFPTQVAQYGIKTDDGFGLAGYVLYHNSFSMFYFVKLRPDFSFENLPDYFDTPREGTGLAFKEGKYVLCGKGGGIQLMQLDKSFAKEYAVTYDTANAGNAAKCIVAIPNGYAVATKKIASGSKACLIILDNFLQNPQETCSTNQPEDPVELVVTKNAESLIMICKSGSQGTIATVYKIPVNGGNFQTLASFGNTTIRRAIITHDGHLVMVGVNNNKIILIKVNADTGDELWRSELPGKDGQYVTQLTDHGFLIGGYDNMGYSMLIRTNAEGKLE